MANEKIAKVIRGDDNILYYSGAPDDVELVTAIFQTAYGANHRNFSLIDELPEGKEAFPFSNIAQRVDDSETMNLGREAERLQGLQARLTTYLSQ